MRTKLGEGETGVALVRSALALALAENASSAAADAYFRLGSALEHAAAYPAAIDAYATAYDYCRTQGLEGPGDVCRACLAPILVHTGDWRRAAEVCREVLKETAAPPLARMVATGQLGHVYALRGEPGRGRRLLAEALAFARQTALCGIRPRGRSSSPTLRGSWLCRIGRACRPADGGDTGATPWSFASQHRAIAALRWT